MTIQQVIEKAIEGGWAPKGLNCDGKFPSWIKQAAINRSKFYERYFLDPLFWQSLGKAMGCPTDICKNCGEVNRCLCGGEAFVPGWEYNWLLFIHHLASGKDAESFFETFQSSNTNPQ